MTYFACPDPAAFAPDRFPVWIWMDEPCFYGFPTYGEAGPKAAQDCGGLPVEPATGRSSATRPPSRGSRRSWRATCRRRSGRRSTRRPACTRSRRIAISWSIACPRRPGVDRRARCRPRLQVRLGPRPDRGRAAGRRRDPVGRRSRPTSGSTGRSCSRRIRRPPGWSDRDSAHRYGSAFAPNGLLCHRTASFGRGRAQQEETSYATALACPDGARPRRDRGRGRRPRAPRPPFARPTR